MPAVDLSDAFADALALEAPIDRKRMLLVVNPHATTVSPGLRTLVVSALEGRYDVTAVDTTGRDHATVLCREAAHEGYDVVVAFGGDGTVNEAANGLAGSATPLTCLPGGATNVYCRMLGIPNDVVDATARLLRLADDWRPRPVDVGVVNGRRFLFSSGYGLDAAVVRRVDAHPRTKARLRHWYFAWAGVSEFLRDYVVRPPRIDVEAAGERVRGVTALVQTGDPYTYFGHRALHVAEGSRLDDGTLAGAVLKRAAPQDAPTIIARLFASRLRVVDHRRVHGFTAATEVRCTSVDGRPIAVQVDGDWIGDAPAAHYEIVPGGLTVVA
jgi:diacylglycerol kinase family enzyme